MANTNDARTAFDKKLDTIDKKISTELNNSFVFVNDTLEIAWASAQTVFGNNATPNLALAIYQLALDELEADRRKKHTKLQE